MEMKTALRIFVLAMLGIFASACAGVAGAQTDFRKDAVQGDYVAKDFHFHDGETMPELKLHYATWGTPRRNAAGEIVNAALLLHGTGGAGINFAGRPGVHESPLLGAGGPVDTTIFYVIAPDAIGSGGSSTPSDGMRQKFPHYNLEDVVAAGKLVVESLGVHHLALVTGISLGGRTTWQWAVQYPDFMDALVPMIASPKPNAGRRGQIDFLAEAIVRNDPDFDGGNYKTNPHSVALAKTMYGMWLSQAAGLQEEYPTREAVGDEFTNMLVPETDANDFIYQVRMNDGFDAWSQLAKVRAPVLIINMAGDLMVPAQLGDAKAAAAKLKDATYIEVAEGSEYGHGGLMRTISAWGPKMRAWLEAREPQNFSH
jgi:homoserine O-acetyltransferase/O-succinyltransferase